MFFNPYSQFFCIQIYLSSHTIKHFHVITQVVTKLNIIIKLFLWNSSKPSELPKYKLKKLHSAILLCIWNGNFILILNLEIHPTSCWCNALIICKSILSTCFYWPVKIKCVYYIIRNVENFGKCLTIKNELTQFLCLKCIELSILNSHAIKVNTCNNSIKRYLRL